MEELDLRDLAISDAGLRYLKPLTELKTLSLDHTRITDSGLLYLGGLTKLRFLMLVECPNITDDGVAKLQQLLPNCSINTTGYAGAI